MTRWNDDRLSGPDILGPDLRRDHEVWYDQIASAKASDRDRALRAYADVDADTRRAWEALGATGARWPVYEVRRPIRTGEYSPAWEKMRFYPGRGIYAVRCATVVYPPDDLDLLEPSGHVVRLWSRGQPPPAFLFRDWAGPV